MGPSSASLRQAVLPRRPLGFDAGDANLYRYVRNAPTALRDPFGLEAPKLSVKETVAPMRGLFGDFLWGVVWDLAKPSPGGGVVIQQLEVSFDVKDQNGKAVRHRADDGKWKYFEAWPVNKNQKATTVKQVHEAIPNAIRAVKQQGKLVSDEVKRLQGILAKTKVPLARAILMARIQSLQLLGAGFTQQEAALVGLQKTSQADDYFAIGLGQAGTTGTITFTGRATFLEGVTLAQLARYGFRANNRRTHAGALPAVSEADNKDIEDQMTTLQCVLFAKEQSSDWIEHSITVEWDATAGRTLEQSRTVVKRKVP